MSSPCRESTKTPSTANWSAAAVLQKLLPRTLDDIRALGGNDAADERRFQTVASVSEINRGLYRGFASPVVKAMTTEHSAKFLRETHPNRVAFAAFSDGNPLMRPVEALATAVRAARHRSGPRQITFLAMEKMGSDWIVTGLNAIATICEAWTEATFLGVYGSRWLQTVGLLRIPFRQSRKSLAIPFSRRGPSRSRWIWSAAAS